VNNPPAINETLALLDTLKGVLEEFAVREEKLNADFNRRSNQELNNFEVRTTSIESKVSQISAQIESALDTEEARRETRHQARKAALHRAHLALKNHIERDLAAMETRLNDSVRENTLLAERQRDDNLAAELAAFQDFQQRLAESSEKLIQLETSALKACGGFGQFRKWLAPGGHVWPEPDFSPDEQQLLAEFQRLTDKAGRDLTGFQNKLAPKFFRFVPPWLGTALLLALTAAPALQFAGVKGVPPALGAVGLGGLAGLWLFYWLGRRAAAPHAKELAGDLFKARRVLDGCYEKSALRHDAGQQRIQDESVAAIYALNQDWKQQVRDLAAQRVGRTRAADEKATRIEKRIEEFHGSGLERFKQRQAESFDQARAEAATKARDIATAHQTAMARLKGDHQSQWQALEADWKKTIEPLWSKISEANAAAGQLFPAWSESFVEQWTPPAHFQNAAPLARLQVSLSGFADKSPRDKRLAFPGPKDFSVPLTLTFPAQGSLLFETGAAGGAEAASAINNLIFRLLATTPPGRVNFTIFDPVGLGQNFAALMHLADYEESSIESRIWTQSAQFEEKLAELNEHMEKVIQMYLRNEYATIAEYNAQAGSVAEKYHFLIIASFPANFTDTALRRLRNIAASGARCGVFTFIQWDQRVPLPADVVLDELRSNSVCLKHTERGFELAGRDPRGTRVELDPPPAPDLATRFLHLAGQHSKNSTRVEVPFSMVMPPENEFWTEDTVEELRVPIGRSGATKLQQLAIGKATRQHALIAGKTGSGKSTLFHVIITNLALWCSPEQVEFYLVDFKKGVEFKCYATRKLPHAKVVAIESDRAFGLSVLQRVDDELRRRGDLFRQLGAQDLAGYRRAGGKEPMPRSLLIIDEFQEFFVEEDRISQGAAGLLDRIVRQGRAFGIHVLLGSQTLGGAYTLARATIGQMVIRIALQCNEADAYLIMDQDNPAPRLLTRPGEGIYNDTAGSIEGNSPFQTVWLADHERDAQLAKIRAHADKLGDKFAGPIVFEGNAPADVQENPLLQGVLQSAPAAEAPAAPRIWLGAPNSIKGPTEVVFQRQSGGHLLVIGQAEERAQTILGLALLALAAQLPRNGARFVVLDGSTPGSPAHEFFQQAARAVPQELTQVNNANLTEVFTGLAAELKRREGEDQSSSPEIFILIHGLQNFKRLRAEDEFSFSSSGSEDAPNPSAVLLDLLREGPARGIHALLTCDTYNSVVRFLGRKTLGEFGMRVLFQMSAADSASLIDDPAASTLGFYRALLYLDREGTTEIFRPYALPGQGWMKIACKS
jgi:hypothetical protein